MKFIPLVKKYLSAILLIFLAILFFQACSTKKNTWTRRAYHNLTSHYNVYWNGNESLKTGINDLRKSAIDNYSEVLRVFNYGTESDASRLNSSMERAIEKGAIGVQKHSMVFNRREVVRWIDDSYLMMGKAHFYKHDYISARRTFEFVAQQYSYNDIVHTANLWVARTNIELEQYDKALGILEDLLIKRREGLVPAEVSHNLSLVLADYYIVRENYQAALPYLERSLKESNSKYLKTRAMYIIAQIHLLQDDKAEAIKYFSQVIRKNPPFDMAFESRINIALAYDKNTTDSKSIVKVLQKMLKGEKNKDYKDRIYYALAEIALENEEEELAMEYLALSVSSSTKNRQQQATSALMLADMHFSRNDYFPSQAYYDTAVSALTREYPGYDSIRNKSLVLNDLVDQLSTIQLQDSLLKLAYMDSTARLKIIDNIIKEIVEEERKRAAEEREMERNVMMSHQLGDRGFDTQQSREWYFYNPNTLSFGYTEFLRKWGRRKLEDNWRISDKHSMVFETIESVALDGTAGGAEGDSVVVYTEKDREYYLQDIPLTEEEQDLALYFIEEAINSAGYIYQERLMDYPRSIEQYLALNERFPESEHLLQSWYALYKMYGEQNDPSNAAIYKNKILDLYPNTDYAKVISDPDYFVKKAATAGESLLLYEQTFEAYKNEQYYRVLMNANRARNLYPDDVELLPNFDFLRAIAKGQLEVVDSMAMALNDLLLTYPKSDVAPVASAILRNMNQEFNMNLEIPVIEGDSLIEPKEEPSPYIYDINAAHMVIIIASNEKVKTDPLRIRISDFNTRNYKSAQLMVKSLVLNDENMLLTVGNFTNARAAQNYRNDIFISDYVFGGIDTADFKVFPISLTNYPVFYRLKEVEAYESFWKDKYESQ